MSHGLPVRDILGVEVVAAHGQDVVAALDAAAARGQTVRLAYLNAHASNLAAGDAALRAALAECWVLNDGVGLDIASQLLHGARFPENLNGTDFTVRFLQESSRTWKIFLLGSRDGVAAQAGAALTRAAPQHRIVGVHHGYFAKADEPAVLARIRESGADLVLVAFGNPKQERWIADNAAATGASLLMGVGALFDFLSGEMRRAPKWVRNMRVEWVYRLWLEPRRLGARYMLGNPYFLARTLRRRLLG